MVNAKDNGRHSLSRSRSRRLRVVEHFLQVPSRSTSVAGRTFFSNSYARGYEHRGAANRLHKNMIISSYGSYDHMITTVRTADSRDKSLMLPAAGIRIDRLMLPDAGILSGLVAGSEIATEDASSVENGFKKWS